MKILLITLGLAAVLGQPAFAAKDAYLESLIRKTIEAKRAAADAGNHACRVVQSSPARASEVIRGMDRG